MKSRKLLSVAGATVITLGAGAAAATGNLMAPDMPREPVVKKADAGSLDAGMPAPKKSGKGDKARQ